MKTKLVTLFMIAFISCSLLAQNTNKQSTPEDKAKKQTERMKDKLDLTPEQEKKINDIFLKAAKQEEEQRKKREENHTKTETAIKSELTPDQQAKFDKWKSDKDGHTKRCHQRSKNGRRHRR